jgi:hypothetical protein
MKKHANTYKNMFSHKEVIRDLICGFVKQDWINELDFDSLERVSDSFVTDDIRDREDDIIWRLRLGPSWIYVYLLIEFQSTVDNTMAIRIMTYIGLLYQDLIKTKKVLSGEKLPPVLPIVLYNGAPRWNAPVEVSELIAHVAGGLEIYKPHLRFLLLDEGAYKDHELAPLKNLVAAIFRLENSPSPEKMKEILIALLEWLNFPEQQHLVRAFIVWFRRVLCPDASDEIPRIENLQEAKTMLVENVAKWAEDIRRESTKKAKKEGKKEGQVNLLTKQLKLKFGHFPSKYHTMIQTANVRIIEGWAEKILTANTIDDVFGEE